jgi:hypothetical protein
VTPCSLVYINTDVSEEYAAPICTKLHQTPPFSLSAWIFTKNIVCIEIKILKDKTNSIQYTRPKYENKLLEISHYMSQHLNIQRMGYKLCNCSRCWTVDSLYTFKCKRFRNSGHAATFGIPFWSFFWKIFHYQYKSRWTVTIPGKTHRIFLHYNSSKHCTRLLNTFK